MASPQNEPRPLRTLRQYFWDGLKNTQRQRPLSFYLLLSIPVVLLLAVHLFRSLDDPRRLALGLSLLFVFLGVVLIGAFMDTLSILRESMTTRRKSYKETLGDEEFLAELRENRLPPDE